MGFKEGKILLDIENGIYRAGQTLHGKLVFQQDKFKKFRGIYVKVHGFCHIHWSETRNRRVGDRTEKYTVNHNADEDYFNNKYYLIGGESGENHLQPGKYEFPFQCLIPSKCPSSFESEYGHIRYNITAVVDRAFKPDQVKELTFKVIQNYNLNENPNCKEPALLEMEETYCCCCFSYGMCSLQVRLPSTGFQPKQAIPIQLDCNNNSSLEINSVKFSIIQKTKFHAVNEPDTKTQSVVLAKKKHGPIPISNSENLTVELVVPDVEVYNVDACRFIDIEYEFQVIMDPQNCHSASQESCRIYLGTPEIGVDHTHIPLREPGIISPPMANQFQHSIPGLPIINQPQMPTPHLNNTLPYPGGDYHTGTYPGRSMPIITGNALTPNINMPYPTVNSPYYPSNNVSSGNLPYPAVSPLPGTMPSPGNMMFPSPSIYNSPNPAQNPPYPSSNAACPSGLSSHPPYPLSPALPQSNTSLPPYPREDLAGTPGVHISPANPYPPKQDDPYARATAPEPGTPDASIPREPPYNPEFMK